MIETHRRVASVALTQRASSSRLRPLSSSDDASTGVTGQAPGRFGPDDVLRLQRTAGNGAVAQLMSGPVVQRHNSYEHQLLGDTKPSDVPDAKLPVPERTEAWFHILEEEYQRVTFFKKGAELDPRPGFPGTHWIQLGASRLWVSAGELAAFGDYLPNPETIDTLDRKSLVPILQRMRQEIARAIYDRFPGNEPETDEDRPAWERRRNRETTFTGAAPRTGHLPLPDTAQTIQDLNAATAVLGPNRSNALMARNACHFAPSSWERWSLYHNEARTMAKEAHQSRGSGGSAGAPTADRERKAWVTNGYSNHFLQDSFAAGHLINKTLVMQWFAEYTSRQGVLDKPRYGVPDKHVLDDMSAGKQPDLANRRAYSKTRLHTTATEDRADHSTTTDPQTITERRDQEGRVAGTGLHSTDPEATKEYGEFASFLNSAYLNLAANDIHDYFNENGLLVSNKAGDKFVVGGDGTLLAEDQSAIAITLRADALADQAIEETLATGDSQIKTEDIFALFPSAVWVDGKRFPLEDWNDEVVKRICEARIFPEMVKKWAYKGVRAMQPELIHEPGPGGGVLTPRG
jgi:hypothetical protein